MNKNQFLKLVSFTCVLLWGGLGMSADGPTMAQKIKGQTIFTSPIIWVGAGEPPQAESTALQEALNQFQRSEPTGGTRNGIAALEGFIVAHPESRWTPSIRVHLAEHYRNSGRYTLALAHWQAAWLTTKNAPADEAANREIAERAVAGWTRLLGSLGRKNEQGDLFAEAKKLGLDKGAQAPFLQATREGLEIMKLKPEISYRCGSFALGQLVKCVQPTNEVWKAIHATDSPEGGFKLSQLVDLAAKYGQEVVAVRREGGDQLVVPSVVHWQLDHYAAILEQRGNFYRVKDPTFGAEKWLDAEVINAEASGNFLILNGELPAGWRALTKVEADQIHGKGYPNDIPYPDDGGPDDEGCPPPPPPEAGDGPGAGDGEGCPDSDPSEETEPGMPQWRVSEPYIALWLYDTPLFYRNSASKPVKLKLSYKHTAEARGQNVPGFGPGWECNWFGMLEEKPTSGGGPIVRINNFHALGGNTSMPTSGAKDFKGGRSVQFNTGSGWSSGDANTYSGGAVALRIDRRSARADLYGSVLRYGDGTMRYFRTNQIDQYGRAFKYHYSSNYVASLPVMRLNQMVDVDGKTNTLAYTNAAFPYLITSVTDPYQRVARFFYDHLGRLTNITDVAGMPSSFQYEGTGHTITNMVTPYGNTQFRYFSGVNSYCALNRGLEITEPSGHKQLYTYHDNSPYGAYVPDTYEGCCNSYRNSFHWNRQQYAVLSEYGKTNVLEMEEDDYKKGSIKHWFHGAGIGDSMSVIGTLSGQAGPVVDNSGNRANPIAYQYTGQSGPFLEHDGSYKTVTAVRRSYNNLLEIERNAWGRPTKFIYHRNGTTGVYTNEFNAEGRILLRVWGPDGDRMRGYGYDGTLTNLLTSVTNALGEVIRYTHDAAARVTSITLPSGLITTNRYYTSGDYAGFLADTREYEIVSGSPVYYRTNSYSYQNGNVYVHTNELGLVVTNLWDDLNRLVSTIYPDGTTVSNRYDATRKLDLIATKDRLNQWTYYGYNNLRQQTAVTNVSGQFMLYDYCNCGSPSEIRQWTGGGYLTTTMNYDLAGRLTNIVYPDLYSKNYRFGYQWPYGSGVNTATIEDSAGVIVQLQNAEFGELANVYLTQYTDPNSWPSSSDYLLKRTYDLYGRIATVTDRNGVTITNAYDVLGRLTNRATVDFYGNVSNTVSYAYTARGLTNSTDELGHKTWFLYDAGGRLLAQTNANDEVLQFTYNAADQMLTLKDGKNQQTSWNYDAYGRVTNKLDAVREIFRYKYDPLNRLTNRWTAQKGDTYYKYDLIGNLTNVDYPGTIMDIVLKYDGLNQLTNVTDAVGTTRFTYDNGGMLLREDGPWADDAISYGYVGRRRTSLAVTQPNASPWTQNYDYDQYNRLSSVASTAGKFIYQYWNAFGTPSDRAMYIGLAAGSSATDRNYIYNEYDMLARLTSSTLYGAGSVLRNQHGYEMNQANQRTRQTVNEGYNIGGWASSRFMDYTYDDIGQLKTAKGKDRVINTTTWDYDEIPRRHEQFGYAYDKAWNLSYRTNNALVQTFTVNTLNELTNVTRSGTLTVAGQATGPRADTTYGPVNGVTNVVVSGTGLTTGNALLYADGAWAKTNATLANGNNSYTATAYDTYNRTATDSLTINLPATNTFVYDFNGNLTNDSRRVFEYDYENQLTNVYVASAWKSEFRYDAFGRKRVQKDYGWTGSAWLQTNEVHYLYDGMLVVQERNANNVALVSYTRGNDLSGSLQGAGGIGGLLARTDHAQLLSPDTLNAHAYYHTDGNGNVTCLINTNGLVLARYNYDPYGNLLGMSGPLAEANAYRFSSKEWNGNVGLYYYGYRCYEPNLQRWLNRDPLVDVGGVIYALENPFFESSSVDDDGNNAHWESMWVELNLNAHGTVKNDPVNSFDLLGLCDDSLDAAARSNPGEVGRLAAREAAEGRQYAAQKYAEQQAKEAFRNKLRDAFGNGLKGSRKIDPKKLKDALSKDQLKEAQEIAKTGMRKASDLLKNSTSENTRRAAIEAFETQMNRFNACTKALGM